MCFCSGKEAVFIVVVGRGYLYVFVRVVGFCLAVLEVQIGINVYEIVFNYVHSGKSGLSPPLFYGWPEEGRCRGQGRPRYFPAVVTVHKPCCPLLEYGPPFRDR